MVAGEVRRCRQFAQFVDSEFLSKVVKDVPRGSAGEASPAQRCTDLGEGPAVPEVGRGLQRGLKAAAPGEDDGDELPGGTQGVTEVSAAGL